MNTILFHKTAPGSVGIAGCRIAVRLLVSTASVLAATSVSRADLLAVDWTGNAWLIDECTGEALGSTPTGYFQLNSLARDSQGTFYTVGSTALGNIFGEQLLLTVDPATGIASPVAALPLNAGIEGTVRALAFSPDDVLYATVRTPFREGAVALYTIDVTTGVTTLIGEMGIDHVQAMTCSDDGIFYGIDELGRLGVIDVITGLIAPIGDTPGLVGLDSLGFGPTGILYAIQHDLDGLYSLNPATGAARLIGVGNYGDVRGLEYIPGSSPDPVPPTVSCSVATPTLAPANGGLVNVGLHVNAQDDEDAAPHVSIHIFSNEPGADDAVLGPDGLELRAERLGNGDGRVYLIVVTATDCCGLTGHDCCTVVVPHNNSAAAELSVALDADLAETTCDTSGSPPEWYVLVGSADLP